MSLTAGANVARTGSTCRRLSRVIALALAACASAPHAVHAQDRFTANVLAIHSGGTDYFGNPAMDAGIRQGLLSVPPRSIGYFSEFLEFERFPEMGSSPALADHISRKYAGRRIDLVIAVTNRSLNFVMEHRGRLFPHAPVVFAAATIEDEKARGAFKAQKITGVKVGGAWRATAEMALTLHPTVRRLHVVSVSPNPLYVEAVRSVLRPVAARVPITFVEAATLPELKAAVRAVPRDGLILYVMFQQQGMDYLTNPRDAATLVASNARVPVYGAIDTLVGTGIVGGMVRDTRGTGVRAGVIARRILDGVSAREIPVEDAPVAPMVDWRQVQRWGIDVQGLPEDADVAFKLPTAWETYRLWIVAAVILLGAQLALIAGLLSHRRRWRRAEETLRKREATLRTSYGRIRQLAGGLIHAQETTRVEIARDLHDDICQDLIGVAMGINSLANSTGRVQDPRTQYSIAKIHRWALTIADRVRQISHELHPATLQLLGLSAALRTHCVEVEKRHDVQVSFEATTPIGEIPGAVGLCLFRIAQEALRNGAVHGGARRLRVTLSRFGDSIELAVADDGTGFDVESVRRYGRGLGLVSMEERARLAGGEVLIVSRPARGTAVLVRVPVRESGDHAEEEAVLPAAAAQVQESQQPQESSCQTVAVQ